MEVRVISWIATNATPTGIAAEMLLVAVNPLLNDRTSKTRKFIDLQPELLFAHENEQQQILGTTYLDLGAKADQTLCVDSAIDVGEDRSPDTRPAKIVLYLLGIFKSIIGCLSVALARLNCSHFASASVGGSC